jgi:hypothetical protein
MVKVLDVVTIGLPAFREPFFFLFTETPASHNETGEGGRMSALILNLICGLGGFHLHPQLPHNANLLFFIGAPHDQTSAREH